MLISECRLLYKVFEQPLLSNTFPLHLRALRFALARNFYVVVRQPMLFSFQLSALGVCSFAIPSPLLEMRQRKKNSSELDASAVRGEALC